MFWMNTETKRIRLRPTVNNSNNENMAKSLSSIRLSAQQHVDGCVSWYMSVVITSRITLLFYSCCDATWVTKLNSTLKTDKAWGPQVCRAEGSHCALKNVNMNMHRIFTAALCGIRHCKSSSSAKHLHQSSLYWLVKALQWENNAFGFKMRRTGDTNYNSFP